MFTENYRLDNSMNQVRFVRDFAASYEALSAVCERAETLLAMLSDCLVWQDEISEYDHCHDRVQEKRWANRERLDFAETIEEKIREAILINEAADFLPYAEEAMRKAGLLTPWVEAHDMRFEEACEARYYD